MYHIADNSYPGPSSLSIFTYLVKAVLSSSNLLILSLNFLRQVIPRSIIQKIKNIRKSAIPNSIKFLLVKIVVS